ncbi:histidine phosphatase family protein [Lachnospiraceae bacterium MD1]|jgi:probable phosphoglycerate mutase|uniref:Histidine phosphatase family protein n=1 Tax=Variimorphobacter saccharofermentans TaxID=2755051 RepID=A0A839K0M3_9FIRM|nr:histidine phosphatase family protein [Variimorphobacter saccharofermentans]MBB2183254.1 histidine phosphatase family protein [Variimorphobacter saccharofermentans]
MRLLIIRHGDPDYEKDSLTDKGWKEAEILSNRIAAMDIKEFYVSPLGRARDTANVTLNKMKRTAEVLPWLREFDALIYDESLGRERICWDLLPQDWTVVNEYYDKDRWYTAPIMKKGNVIAEANKVFEGIDKILDKHGYVREGNLYRAINPNRDTIVLFCHFGVECLILSHLLGISPVVLWHGFCAAPTSVTTLITEERRKGIAYFRMSAFGDVSHLYKAGEEPSFAARFCENYDNFEERHD